MAITPRIEDILAKPMYPELFEEGTNGDPCFADTIKRYGTPDGFCDTLKWIAFRIFNAVKAAFSCFGCCKSDWQSLRDKLTAEGIHQIEHISGMNLSDEGKNAIGRIVEAALNAGLISYNDRRNQNTLTKMRALFPQSFAALNALADLCEADAKLVHTLYSTPGVSDLLASELPRHARQYVQFVPMVLPHAASVLRFVARQESLVEDVLSAIEGGDKMAAMQAVAQHGPAIAAAPELPAVLHVATQIANVVMPFMGGYLASLNPMRVGQMLQNPMAAFGQIQSVMVAAQGAGPGAGMGAPAGSAAAAFAPRPAPSASARAPSGASAAGYPLLQPMVPSAGAGAPAAYPAAWAALPAGHPLLATMGQSTHPSAPAGFGPGGVSTLPNVNSDAF